MKTHILKMDTDVFQQSWMNRRPWEIRFNDRDFQVGDVIQTEETVHTGQEMAEQQKPLAYTGRYIRSTIEYIECGPRFGLQEGWCLLTINPFDKGESR